MKKSINHFIFMVCLLRLFIAPHAFSSTINESNLPSLAPVVDKISAAVVTISVYGKQSYPPISSEYFYFSNPYSEANTQRPFWGEGTGVIIDAEKGIIITNYHMIEDATEINITLKSGQKFIAQTIAQDQESDIALLQIKTTHKLTQFTFADSDKLRVGDFVIAIGNPFGFGQIVTSGIISALGQNGAALENPDHFIQTDAAVNSGSSGGPLVNLKGELIGMNSAILDSDGGKIGIGFAIPSNRVQRLAQQLLQYGKIHRSVLGVKGQALTPELARIFSLSSPYGAFITEISPNSAAEKAGLKAGDIISALNGKAINSFAELRAQIGLLSIGTKIFLEVIQNNNKMNISAILAAPPAKDILAKTIHPLLSGTTLNTIKNARGVIITEIRPDSIAHHKGLQENDIIVAINRMQIQHLNELTELLKTSPPLLAIKIKRNNRFLYVLLN